MVGCQRHEWRRSDREDDGRRAGAASRGLWAWFDRSFLDLGVTVAGCLRTQAALEIPGVDRTGVATNPRSSAGMRGHAADGSGLAAAASPRAAWAGRRAPGATSGRKTRPGFGSRADRGRLDRPHHVDDVRPRPGRRAPRAATGRSRARPSPCRPFRRRGRSSRTGASARSPRVVVVEMKFSGGCRRRHGRRSRRTPWRSARSLDLDEQLRHATPRAPILHPDGPCLSSARRASRRAWRSRPPRSVSARTRLVAPFVCARRAELRRGGGRRQVALDEGIAAHHSSPSWNASSTARIISRGPAARGHRVEARRRSRPPPVPWSRATGRTPAAWTAAAARRGAGASPR